MKTEITIGFDPDSLRHIDESQLVCLWAVTQANPAPIDSREAGHAAEMVGREIIRRFCALVGVPLWNHQGHHAYSLALSLHGKGKWVDGAFVPNVTPEVQTCSSQ